MEYSFRTLSLSDILNEARQKDDLYIAQFARIMPDGSAMCKFKIVANNDTDDYANKFWIIRDDGPTVENITAARGEEQEEENHIKPSVNSSKPRHAHHNESLDDQGNSDASNEARSKKNPPRRRKRANIQRFLDIEAKEDEAVITHDKQDGEDQEQHEEDTTPDRPPQLLECTLYGELSFMDVGPYGNWVPVGMNENPDNIMYPAADPARATVIINLNAHPVIAQALQIIDDAMKAHLQQVGQTVTTYNPMVRRDRVTMKYPLLVPLNDWLARNELLQEKGESKNGIYLLVIIYYIFYSGI